jgi:hypothetical protein
MVFFLRLELRAIVEEESDKLEEIVAQLVLGPHKAIFEKPEESKHHHMKEMHVSSLVNRKPMSKMLVDLDTAVNVMTIATFWKLDKS